MMITGIQSYDYNELQRIQQLMEKHARLYRVTSGKDRARALVYLIQDQKLYESSWYKFTKAYPKLVVGFVPIFVGKKVIYLPTSYK